MEHLDNPTFWEEGALRVFVQHDTELYADGALVDYGWFWVVLETTFRPVKATPDNPRYKEWANPHWHEFNADCGHMPTFEAAIEAGIAARDRLAERSRIAS